MSWVTRTEKAMTIRNRANIRSWLKGDFFTPGECGKIANKVLKKIADAKAKEEQKLCPEKKILME